MVLIKQAFLSKLFQSYVENLSVDHERSFASFAQACQSIEDYLEYGLDWEDLSLSSNRDNALHILLTQSLTVENQALVFNPLACHAGLLSMQYSLDETKPLYLAHDVNATGIQEKYLKLQLSAQEALTSLDIKRFIRGTDMAEAIQVARLEVEELGIILSNARKKHIHANEPYAVAIMMAAPQWLSVIVNVDPLSNRIAYKVNSEQELSAAQDTIIKEAIKFGAGTDYAAFPGTDQIIAAINTIKPASGGYKVLHQLYQDDTLVLSEKAQSFAQTENNIKALRNAVYEVELRDILLDPTSLNILNAQTAFKFHEGQIKEEALNELQSILGSSPPLVSNQHPLVAEKIAELQLYHNKINFPGFEVSKSLTSVDYQLFLLLVDEKFKNSGTGKILNEIVIRGDAAALDGLIAYHETNATLPTKTLTLDLEGLDFSDTAIKVRFLFNLKTMLLTISGSNLAGLKLHDPHGQLDAAAIKEIAVFVQERHVALDINLPKAYQSSLEQKIIDEAVSDSLRQKKLLALGKTERAVSDTSSALAPEIRQRPRGAKQSIAVDIELQQEQQVEVAVESMIAQSSAMNGAPETGDTRFFNLEQFKKALQAGHFSHNYLIDSSPENAEALWCNWLGFLSTAEAIDRHNIKLSKSACDELIEYQDKFQYGLDQHNLPPGFIVKTDGYDSNIHFDANLKLLTPYNPLQVQITESIPELSLAHLQFKAWLASAKDHPIQSAWTKIDAGAYDKKAHQLFKRHLPQMLLLDTQVLKQLFSICFNAQGQFRAGKFRFLLEHSAHLKTVLAENPDNATSQQAIHNIFKEQSIAAQDFIQNYAEKKPDFAQHVLHELVRHEPSAKAQLTALITKVADLNLNGLMQVYLQAGEDGLAALNRIVDSDHALFTQLNSQVFAHNKSYLPLLDEKYQDALQAIQGFSGNERVWWNALLAQHCIAQTEVNLVDLVNAFKQFKIELKELPTHDNSPLEFSAECSLSGVMSLPVALSRMLTLMKHVSQVNRVEQWNVIGSLDFSSTGLIKLLSLVGGKKWAFITPEMAINPQSESSQNLNLERYQVIMNWKEINRASPDDVVNYFFRAVSFQVKNEQLPLEFYRYVHDILQQSKLPFEAKKGLYAIMASATTDEVNMQTIKSLTEAKKDFDGLLKLITDTPLPGFIPEFIKNPVRMTLLGSLTELDRAPPLPVLNRLVRLICTSLDSVAKVAQNARKLEDANAALQFFVSEYDSSIYEGMRDYQDEDYKSGELFFSHIDTLKRIQVTFDETEIGALTGMMCLISSFKLRAEDIGGLQRAHFDKPARNQRPRRDEALFILRKLSVQEGAKPLRAKDLDYIFNQVKERADDQVIDVIKSMVLPPDDIALVDYFSVDFLEDYGKSALSIESLKKLSEHFNEQQQAQIQKMLQRFSGPTDHTQYDKMIDKLIGICNPLNKIETNIFISKLTTSLGLFTDLQPLEAVNNPFVRLLNLINANGSTDDFINLIAAERNLLGDCNEEQVREFFISPKPDEFAIPYLAEKTLLYMETLLPGIKDLALPYVSQMDLTPRLLNVILKTPVAQLKASSAVECIENTYFLQQHAELANVLDDLGHDKKIDFTQLAELTNTFTQKTGFQTRSYQETLIKLNNSELGEKDQLGLIKNPALQALITYICKPDSLPDEQRLMFAAQYQEKLNQYPDVTDNSALLEALFANPCFFKALAEKDALNAAKDPNFLNDDAQSAVFFAAVEQDLKEVAQFKKQTQNLQTELKKEQTKLNSYPTVFVDLFKKINNVAGANPNSKKQFLSLFDSYLQHYSPVAHGELLNYLTHFVSSLEQSFAKVADKNIVLSLCLQFNSDEDEELTPEKLIELLQSINALPESSQFTLLKVAVALINNEKEYSLDAFKKLCDLAKENPQFVATLASLYERAPFPEIHQVMQWHHIANGTNNYTQAIAELARHFSIHPCHREPENGFQVDKAVEQIALFQINGKPLSTQMLAEGRTYYESFQQKTMEMRAKTCDELLALFAGFRGKNPDEVDNDTLVAIAAELLHRSKGKDELDAAGQYKLGSSMEINTTQYMAILSMIKTPGHVTSQIGTGEGKSRIMMIALACQNAFGQTVDFVTSDVQLATRDFVAFQAYFELIGAKTSMIFADTDPTQYLKGGINFSDASNLSLFRNKARSMGTAHLVLDEDPRKRALMLDEADQTYFDTADTRFNFSKEGDETIRDMEWIYPLLMDYFAQKSINLSTPINSKNDISPLDLYYENIDLSREKLLQYASGNCSATQLMRLKALSNAQLEQWQVSAVTASQLKFKDDFVIEADVLINTALGPKISSEAQLLFANRVAKNSKFSFGVHQCLHARLNSARRHLDSVADVSLREALSQCEQAFYVPDEKQIVYSSTSKNLIDDYKEGTLKAVTGTAGSILEREEARELYGHGANKMQFIDVPRDKGLHRKDKAIHLTSNQNEQIKAFIEKIKEARAKNQPVLIITANDKESEFLFTELNKVFKEGNQRISSQLLLKEENERVGHAGKPCQITISTGMVGRGTDISLRNAAKEHGLYQMTSYLPSLRDLEQFVGRSGRFGAKGETVMILDKQRLKKELGKSALGSDYYRNVEGYIAREHAIMDRTKQCERLIKNTIGDFRQALTHNFFEGMLPHVDKNAYKQLTPAWTAFFDKSDKAWNEQWPRIQKELAADTVNVVQVEVLLHNFKNNAQKMWDGLRRTVNDADVICLDGQTKALAQLNESVPDLTLSATTKKLITEFDIHHYSLDKVKVYDHYDVGHDGRAVTYKHWYTPVIASLKGYANLLPFVNFAEARKPLANFRAWVNGTGQIFPDLRAAIASAVDGIKGFFSRDKKLAAQDEVLQHKEQEAATDGSYRTLFENGVTKEEASQELPAEVPIEPVETPEEELVEADNHDDDAPRRRM